MSGRPSSTEAGSCGVGETVYYAGMYGLAGGVLGVVPGMIVAAFQADRVIFVRE